MQSGGSHERSDHDVGEHLSTAGLFRTLAVALSYPSAARLEEVATLWGSQMERGQPCWPEGMRGALQRALAALTSSTIQVLEAEHVRLFGPAGRCPMFETSFGDAGRMLGKASQLADISGFYIAFGLEPSEAEPLPEDSLLLELEFMSILSLKAAYAHSENLGAQLEVTEDAERKFLTDHLGTWIDGWGRALESAEPPPFYAAVAEAARCLVRTECARLGAEPSPALGRIADREMGGDEITCPATVSGTERGEL